MARSTLTRMSSPGLNITTSVLTGRGGVWVMNPPYLLFYRDRTGDGLPDGDPEVRLAGFGLEDTHSLANSLTWGPDGWLYGVHGSTSTAKVRGVSFLGQAVWRYHPERDEFELFAEGGGNPWTLSFDSKGRAFSGDNGGNNRGFHWVQGGRYEKNWPKHGPFTTTALLRLHLEHGARGVSRAIRHDPRRLRGGKAARLRGTAHLGHGADQPDTSLALRRRRFDVQNSRYRCCRDHDRPQLPSGRYRSRARRRRLFCRLVRHPDGSHRPARHVGQVVRTDLAPARRATTARRLRSISLNGAAGSSSSCSGTRESGTATRHDECSASVKTGRCVPRLRQTCSRTARTARARGALDGEPHLGNGCRLGAALLDHPDAPIRSWTVRLLNDAGRRCTPANAAAAGRPGSQRTRCGGAQRACRHRRAPRGERRTRVAAAS